GLVEEAVEQVGAAADGLGGGLQGLGHQRPVVPADDEDDVVVVAELVEVGAPAFLAVLVGAEEVVARGVVFQAEGGGQGGGGDEQGGDGQDGARAAADGGDQGEQQAPHGGRPSGGDVIGGHVGLLSLPCSVAARRRRA